MHAHIRFRVSGHIDVEPFSQWLSQHAIPFQVIPSHSNSCQVPISSQLASFTVEHSVHSPFQYFICPSIQPANLVASQPTQHNPNLACPALSSISDSVIDFHTFLQLCFGDPDQLEAGKRHVCAGRQALDQPRLASSYTGLLRREQEPSKP